MIHQLELSLRAFRRFRTADVDEARRRVGALLGPHKLQPTGRAATLDVRYSAFDLKDTAILCASYGAPVRIDPGALDDIYLVGMPLAGVSTVRCGDGEIATRVGLASVQSSGQRVVTEWDEDCCKLSVKISRAALEHCLADLLGRAPGKPVVFDAALDLEREPGRSWWRMLTFLMAEVGGDSVFLASESGRRSLDRALISTLLLAQPHTYSDELERASASPVPAHVRKAEELIAANPAAPHNLPDLAAATGVSARSLQHGFQKHRGMTVTEFIRARRLEQARAALLRATARTRITDVALDAGYGHLARFAADYRRRYGEAPSATLRRSVGAYPAFTAN